MRPLDARLLLGFLLCGCAHLSGSATDPEGLSRRDPSSLHAHQRDWPVACHEGLLQSPITIASVEFADDTLSPIAARFGVSEVALVDVGHTLQIRVLRTEDSVEFEGATYGLRQLHFHKPSEHIVDGRQAPMEVHAVFVESASVETPRVLVLGFLIEPGPENATIAPLWSHLEDREGYGEDITEHLAWERAMETRELDTGALEHGEAVILASAAFDLGAFLPTRPDFYVYEGSLTTPDCAEGVTHAVSSTPIYLSEEQIERFEGYYEGNNRDIQPGGDRTTRARRRARLER